MNVCAVIVVVSYLCVWNWLQRLRDEFILLVTACSLFWCKGMYIWTCWCFLLKVSPGSVGCLSSSVEQVPLPSSMTVQSHEGNEYQRRRIQSEWQKWLRTDVTNLQNDKKLTSSNPSPYCKYSGSDKPHSEWVRKKFYSNFWGMKTLCHVLNSVESSD